MQEAKTARVQQLEGWVDWARLQRVPPLAPKTIREYSFRIRSAIRFLDDLLDVATVRDLERHLFAQKPTARTRNQVRCALVNYFEWLIAKEVRQDNPARALARLPEKRPMPVPITNCPELIAEAWAYSIVFGVLVTLYLHTGLRLSEVVGLRWEQIHGSWAYLKQKGDRERSVFLNCACTRALARLERHSEWVFPSPVRPGPLSPQWVWRKIRDLGMRAGIPGCRPHRLRYTFADSMVELSGGDAFAVMEALGQTSLQSAMHYVSARPHKVRHLLEQLPGFLEGLDPAALMSEGFQS